MDYRNAIAIEQGKRGNKRRKRAADLPDRAGCTGLFEGA